MHLYEIFFTFFKTITNLLTNTLLTVPQRNFHKTHKNASLEFQLETIRLNFNLTQSVLRK